MDSYFVDLAMALWFGILTSISPCPLAANIAAISYIGRKVENSRYMFFSGILYMLGRMLSYTVLGIILVSSTQSIPLFANFLQKYMNVILGPLLIIVGIVLLDIIKIPFLSFGIKTERFQKRADKMGIWGAGLLGIVFALSFCPISAGLFFGSLFSVAMKYESSIIMPSLFGFGTAIPVLAFTLVLAFSTKLVGKAFNKLSSFEKWARRISAIAIIIAGIYTSVNYIF